MTEDELNEEIDEAVRGAARRFEKSQEEVTGIPKPFVVEVSETTVVPNEFGLGRLGGAEARAFQEGERTDPPSTPLPPPGTAEYTTITYDNSGTPDTISAITNSDEWVEVT